MKRIAQFINTRLWNCVAAIVGLEAVRHWLVRRSASRPYNHITSADGQDVYMYRFWLFNPYPASGESKRWAWLPSVRIHRIMRADSDRHLHDHPWNARTIILDGWYMEKRDKGHVYGRKKGYTGRLLFGEYHRITDVSAGGVLTLFITWRYRGTWGFLVNGCKVPWREYLGMSAATEGATE